MIDAADQITLRVNGLDYGGWTAVKSIRTGMDAMAGGFELSATERWLDGTIARPLAKEDDVQVRIGDDVVIHGHIDDVSREVSADTHTVTVTGRDATADLVDCATMLTPGDWHDIGLLGVVQAICKPFGIGVVVASGTNLGKAFATFTLQKGERAVAAIQRACAARGVLAYSDGRGVLVLGPGKPGRLETRLVLGDNLKTIKSKDSRLGRYRDYTVYAQSLMWDVPSANAGTLGTAHDPGIRRYRPTARLADDLADGVTAAQQAAWDAMIGRARAESVEGTVRGWRHAGGVWRPNKLVYVDAPGLMVSGWRLITAVDCTQDDKGGTIARLSLLGPGAFDLLAERDKGAIKW